MECDLEQLSALSESIGFLLPVEAGSTSSRLSDGVRADTRHASQTSLRLSLEKASRG